MRIGAFELDEPLPELHDPHVLAMLDPWIDVGEVGTLTLNWLENHFQAEDLGRISRPGHFFDFTRYRPTVYYDEEGRKQISVPNKTEISTVTKLDSAGNQSVEKVAIGTSTMIKTRKKVEIGSSSMHKTRKKVKTHSSQQADDWKVVEHQ